MTEGNGNNTVDELTIEQWLQIRKKEGRKIDPDIAEVMCDRVYVADPYDVDPDLPEECKCSGRAYFARSPDSDIWVWFGDLPDETRIRLWERHKSELALPASLEWLIGKSERLLPGCSFETRGKFDHDFYLANASITGVIDILTKKMPNEMVALVLMRKIRGVLENITDFDQWELLKSDLVGMRDEFEIDVEPHLSNLIDTDLEEENYNKRYV